MSKRQKKAHVLTCADCGLEYGAPGWMDACVPDHIWAQISPTHDEGGILCITCMARRAEKKGLRCPVMIGSGPFAVYSDSPETAIWRARAQRRGADELMEVCEEMRSAADAMRDQDGSRPVRLMLVGIAAVIARRAALLGREADAFNSPPASPADDGEGD